MVRSQKITKKYVSLSTMVASFAGMLMAVPLAYAIGSPANIAVAGQNQPSSLVSQSDFAKYAYAFNQGYEARTASATSSSSTPGVCTDASAAVPESSGAVTETMSQGATGGGAETTSTPRTSWGMSMGMGMGAAHAPMAKPDKTGEDHARWAAMVNSCNSYAVYNSSSVVNTNSNNTVGSNNATHTSIDVADSKHVMIGVSNDPVATQMNTNDSFNKDSYNNTTTTNTAVITDSFNKPVAIDSGNTSTVTNTTNHTDDSYNTVDTTANSNNTSTTTSTSNETTNTAVDSNNTTTTTNTANLDVTNTENKTVDSYNTTDITTAEGNHHDALLPVEDSSTDHQS